LESKDSYSAKVTSCLSKWLLSVVLPGIYIHKVVFINPILD